MVTPPSPKGHVPGVLRLLMKKEKEITYLHLEMGGIRGIGGITQLFKTCNRGRGEIKALGSPSLGTHLCSPS